MFSRLFIHCSWFSEYKKKVISRFIYICLSVLKTNAIAKLSSKPISSGACANPLLIYSLHHKKIQEYDQVIGVHRDPLGCRVYYYPHPQLLCHSFLSLTGQTIEPLVLNPLPEVWRVGDHQSYEIERRGQVKWWPASWKRWPCWGVYEVSGW